LNEELAEQSLEQAECDWDTLVKRVDHKKFGTNPGRTFEALAKRRRFLEYRGFTPAQIKHALSTVDDE